MNWTQPKVATCSELSVIWKRMFKAGVSPVPTNRGPQNHFFSTTSQLNGNFNGLYLRNETWYRQSGKCVDNYKGFPASSKNIMNFGPQTASNWTVILSTLGKFCVFLHCRASHTHFRLKNSTKLCRTVGGKPQQQTAINILGPPPCKKFGALKRRTYFRRFRNSIATLRAHSLYLARNMIQTTGKSVGNYKESAISLQNDMNFGPQTALNPLPFIRQDLSYDDCLEDKMEDYQNLCCIV